MMDNEDIYFRRDPQFRVKPPKETANDADRENYNNKVKEATPTASRHLLFIRHGQYNLEGTKDAERYLTALGQEREYYEMRNICNLYI